MEKSVRDHINDHYQKTGRYHNEMPFAFASKDKEKAEAYNKRYREIMDNFRNDVEEECAYSHWNEGVKDVIWAKAWEEGHSGGFGEILSAYEDLVYFVSKLATKGL